ncbi:MAG: GAF domain-containing protein [Anaerolineales bacterium]|nr:GAF domain-containing protein [Anaerolineales bacterium]
MPALILCPPPHERVLQALGREQADDYVVSALPEFLQALSQSEYDCVLVAGPDAEAGLRQAGGRRPAAPVIVIGDWADGEAVAALFRAGASDVVAWDHLARLPAAVARARAHAAARSEQRAAHLHYRLVAGLAVDFAYAVEVRPDGRFEVGWLSEGLQHWRSRLSGAPHSLDLILAAFHPADLDRVRAHLERLLAGYQDVVEARLLQPDSAPVWLHLVHHPILDAAGRVARVYGAGRDITRRKETEAAERDQRLLAEALRDTAAALNSTLQPNYLLERILLNVGRVVPHEAVDVMLLEGAEPADQVARLVRWQGYENFGLTPEWLRGLRLPLAQYATLQSIVTRQLPVVIADTQRDPHWVQRPELAWIRSIVAAPILVRNRVIGIINALSSQPGFFTALHADRLLAFADQAGVAMSNAQLYESLQQQAGELAALYRASTALVGAPTTLADMAQRITDTLAAEFKFTHTAIGLVDAAAGELVFLALTGHTDAAVRWRLPLAGPGLTVAAARAGVLLYAPEVSGDPRYIQVNTTSRSELVVPLIIAGAVIGVLDLQSPQPDAFSARDQRLIAAFAEEAALALHGAQLMHDLRLAQQTAEAANRSKSEFLANTSHELRTPLTGILGSLDLVLDGLCESPEEERRFLQVASQASRQLLGLINNLLDIAKIEAGQVELLLQEVDPSLILAEAHALIAPKAAEKPVTLRPPAVAAGLPGIWADHTRVRQILMHLLDNALKFTPAGGQIQLTAGPGPSPATVRLSVEDTGVGIPLEQQARLFETFTQVDGSSTRRFGGSGLGLSIARRLAGLMKGSLELLSPGENQGATALLTLPAAPLE